MTPGEWAEVFNAGAASYMRAGNELVNALSAMEKMCLELDQRGRLKEDHFMGKPVSNLTYEEAIRFRDWLWTNNRLISENTSQVISRIIAEGPEPRCTCPVDPDDLDDPGDILSTCPIHGWRSAPIAIIPPTIIEGGQRHGRP